MGYGMAKEPDWMEIIRNLDEFDIRFNPTPWIAPEEFSVKPPVNKVDKNLIDFHIEVAQKVDELIARLELEGNQPEVWDTSMPSEDNDLTPEMITSKIEEIIINR